MPREEGYWYLSSPYTHPDPHVMARRAKQALFAAARMYAAGIITYSPIVEGHAIASAVPGSPTDYGYWRAKCRAMLMGALGLYELELDGWLTSKGMLDEHKIIEDLGRPIHNITMDDTEAMWAKVMEEKAA